MNHEFIPYGRQWVDEEDIQAVVDVLRSDYLTTGPTIEAFEKKFAKYVGAKYAVAISNGTAALHAACFAAGIGEGDEVITTPITFAASANCVLYCGGTPVFADIDPITYNISPSEIRKNITSKTKALIPVHFTGQPCDMDEIYKIAQEYNLIVIEDAAHAIGADYKGRKIGSISDMTTFSFHPVKHITTGEGGMITTNNDELYEKLKLFRSHGITRDPKMLHQNKDHWYYEQIELGYNYRMTDIQAALGLSQLKKADRFLKRRREIAHQYNEAFKGIDGLILPHQLDSSHSSWHLYIIQIDSNKIGVNRDEAYQRLIERKIGANVHYIPVYLHPYYQRLGYKQGLCPQAENLYESMITLPLFPKMTESHVQAVIHDVKEVLG
ncbi:UDP-4-amino-4,6-dideoxy-N-acetyl-beta-L-altrosamine transaminase [Rubeoparvulum massiliense]|uniref:UDP-4-amino-4, 6-dideoxy-N-acetyl-beta-L-altrosamine transaminase n=1 Tax=Rubeoparvulum massiliense TaxID=1631346 RepID=UPI00065E5D4A|nr:UDP-4-amino-4,6-dideoxy-N-acetyl-beta-L-altrosamine transaminase [Rubeoparvulum massiliense]